MDLMIKNPAQIFRACRNAMSTNPCEAILSWRLVLVYEGIDNKMHYVNCKDWQKLRKVYGRYSSKKYPIVKISLIITSNITSNGYDRLVYNFDITNMVLNYK